MFHHHHLCLFRLMLKQTTSTPGIPSRKKKVRGNSLRTHTIITFLGPCQAQALDLAHHLLPSLFLASLPIVCAYLFPFVHSSLTFASVPALQNAKNSPKSKKSRSAVRRCGFSRSVQPLSSEFPIQDGQRGASSTEKSSSLNAKAILKSRTTGARSFRNARPSAMLRSSSAQNRKTRTPSSRRNSNRIRAESTDREMSVTDLNRQVRDLGTHRRAQGKCRGHESEVSKDRCRCAAERDKCFTEKASQMAR